MSPGPADAPARHAATTTYDRNQVVIAGAGSGKTSLLVERILCQIIEQDLGVHDFAAITFTEKAAAELRGRIEAGLARLADLARTPDPALDPAREADRAFAHLCGKMSGEAVAARSRERLTALSSAAIGTIHGFCAALLRRHPLESGLDPDFTVDDGTRYAELCRDLWDDLVGGSEGPEGTAAPEWAERLRWLDVPELEAIALALAQFGAPAGDACALPDARAVLGPLASEWIAEIEALGDDPPTKGPQSYLRAARGVFLALQESGIDEAKRELERALFESARGPKGLLEGSPPTAKKEPEAEALAKRARKILSRLSRIDDERIRRVVELFAPFADRVRAEALARGIVPFDALLACTRDLLRDHPRVRRELGARYRVLLLDEFQDTDPLQYEIVFFLAESADGAPARDAFATRLAPGRLFIVGDPKQAIYRFRGADIAAYHQAVRHVEASGGERLVLTTSFRAAPELLAPLGDLFPALLDAPADARASERDAYSGYDPLEPGRERTNGEPRVELWTVGEPGAKTKATAARRAEAEAIAGWIAAGIHTGQLACADVAILLRAFSCLHLYTRALRERGIPFSLEGGREWSERPEGKQLLALLRALADPDDAPAVIGVLRSPLGGAPDTELAAYAAATGAAATGSAPRWSYLEAGVDGERFPNVARTFALLCDRHAAAREEPLDAWLAALEEHAPIAALHAGAADGAQRVALLRAGIDALVARARQDPSLDLRALVDWLAGRALREPGSQELGSVHAVRLLTIHAAKGLEFPVVILPDLGREPGGGNPRAEPPAKAVWSARAEGIAVHTRAAISSGWLVHEEDEERHAAAEEGRLLYVACTRARERLIFVHAPRDRTMRSAAVHRLQPWSYPPQGLPASVASPHPGVIARAVLGTDSARLDPPRAEPIDPRPALTRTRAVSKALHGRTVPRFRSPSGLREERDERLDTAGEAPEARRPAARRDAGNVARYVGTVLHEVLESWDLRDSARARERIAAASQRCAAEGADCARVADEALRVWDAFTGSELAAYLAGVEIVGREVPLLLEDDDGVVWSGSIDLLYVDAEGRLVVADYKTDRRPGPETNERHRLQLELYGRGVARAIPDLAPPALELLYLRTGGRVRL